jgi:hypothetical protein
MTAVTSGGRRCAMTFPVARPSAQVEAVPSATPSAQTRGIAMEDYSDLEYFNLRSLRLGAWRTGQCCLHMRARVRSPSVDLMSRHRYANASHAWSEREADPIGPPRSAGDSGMAARRCGQSEPRRVP